MVRLISIAFILNFRIVGQHSQEIDDNEVGEVGAYEDDIEF
jgi:hypothetical protein